MKREQLIKAVRKWARKAGVTVEIDSKIGKGSHILLTVGGKSTILKSGRYNPGYIRLVCRQLGIPPDFK